MPLPTKRFEREGPKMASDFGVQVEDGIQALAWGSGRVSLRASRSFGESEVRAGGVSVDVNR